MMVHSSTTEKRPKTNKHQTASTLDGVATQILLEFISMLQGINLIVI